MVRILVAALLLSSSFLAGAASLKPWSGGRTPPLQLADPDGVAHRLADYRGKVVLVNFWATWCAPCRAEMPSIERLRQALEGRPFVVLAVNVGENPAAARSFAEKLRVRFPILLDRDLSVAKAWGAKLLPATFLVGPDGAIKYTYLGDLDWAGPEARGAIEALMPREGLRAEIEH